MFDTAGPSLRDDRDQQATGSIDGAIQQQLVRQALFADAVPPQIGRFLIEERLGAGASSVVYAARDTTLDRRVAVKILASRDRSGAWTRRMHREARALARLSHHNVVSVYEVGDWNGHPFIAMEIVDGTTLARWQAGAGRTPREIVGAYVEAGRGLQAAHEIGLVHRDFKPANVLVASSGRIVVTDFGLVGDAPDSGDGQRSGAAPLVATAAPVGTPAYLAPEQGRGAPPDPRADIYSFSLSLCEALLGRHPLLDAGPPWKGELEGRVARRVRAALCRGLEADPAERWPAMAPLLALLAPRRSRWPRVAVGVGLAATGAAAVALTLVARPALPQTPHDPVDRLVDAATKLVEPDPTAAAALLLEVPPDRRGEPWAVAARSTLLQPIATEIPCRWPAPPVASFVAGELATILDTDGRILACDLRTGAVATVSQRARCPKITEGRLLSALAADGAIELYERRRGAWHQTVRLAATAALPAAETRSLEACRFEVAGAGPGEAEIRLLDGAARWRARWDGEGGSWSAAPAALPLRAGSDDGRRWLRHAPEGPVLAIDRGIDGRDSRTRTLSARAQAVRVDAALRVAAILADERLDIVDLERGAVVASMAATGAKAGRVAVAISRDGRHVLMSTADHVLWWWQAAAGWRSERLLRDDIRAIAPSPGGERAAVLDAWGRVEVHDSRSHAVEQLTSPRRVEAIGFLDEETVVTVDRSGGVARWSLSPDHGRIVAVHTGRVWMVAADPSGSVIASGGKDGTVRISFLDGAPGRVLDLGRDVRVYTLRFDGDRLLVACNDGTVQIWRWRDGARIGTLPGHEVWAYGVDVAHSSGNPDVIVTGSKSGALRLWSGTADAPFATLRDPASDNFRINDLAASADGRLAAAVTASGRLLLADLRAGRLVAGADAHRGWARRVAFDGSGAVVTAGDDGALRRWSVPDARPLWSVAAHLGQILDLDVHDLRALTGADDGTVRLWDLASGALARTFRGHDTLVTVVRWRGDGRWLLTGDASGLACLWRADTDGCQTRFIGGGAVMSGLFAAGGRVVTGSEDGAVRVWKPLYEAPTAQLAAELARRAPACPDEEQRARYLGEAPAVAAARLRKCRAAAVAAPTIVDATTAAAPIIP